MRGWCGEFQHWNSEQAFQKISALQKLNKPLREHIFASPEHKLPRLKLDFCEFIQIAVGADIAWHTWVWCVSCCWLEGSHLLNIWVNTVVKQSPRLEKWHNTSNWSLFFHTSCNREEMVNMQLSTVFANKAGTSLMKSPNKQEKKLLFLSNPFICAWNSKSA